MEMQHIMFSQSSAFERPQQQVLWISSFELRVRFESPMQEAQQERAQQDFSAPTDVSLFLPTDAACSLFILGNKNQVFAYPHFQKQ